METVDIPEFGIHITNGEISVQGTEEAHNVNARSSRINMNMVNCALCGEAVPDEVHHLIAHASKHSPNKKKWWRFWK